MQEKMFFKHSQTKHQIDIEDALPLKDNLTHKWCINDLLSSFYVKIKHIFSLMTLKDEKVKKTKNIFVL